MSSLSPQKTQKDKRRRKTLCKKKKRKKVRQRGASEAKKYTLGFVSSLLSSLLRDVLQERAKERAKERERERDCCVCVSKKRCLSLSFSTRLSLFRRRRRRRRRWRRRRTKRSPRRQRSSRSSATWRCAALPFSRRFQCLLFLLVGVSFQMRIDWIGH